MPVGNADPDAMPSRIGVFGGAFDPPHLTHRMLAETAVKELALDLLLILPTGNAWHKQRTLSDASHRLAMCHLAFADIPKSRIDDREIRRAGASYTVDTLLELTREHPGAHFFLLIGEDQFSGFRSWRDWRAILSMATLVVAARPDESGVSRLSEGAGEVNPGIAHARLTLPLSPISSTTIRAAADAGPDAGGKLAALVPSTVASYISQHSLYQLPS